jgi:mannose-1-phosphate guanylyltransferase/mannose-6-phosphate isomerase
MYVYSIAEQSNKADFLNGKDMVKQNRYVVILAGGKGERLWPLSRESKPKQFLPFNNTSLLEQTAQRIEPLAPKEFRYIVCAQNQEPLLSVQIREKIGTVLTEPNQRNTAPAIALACLEIANKDPDAYVLFVPADHVIEPPADFVAAAQRAFEFCQNQEALVLFGIKPTAPATGYGYLECVSPTKQQPAKIIKFHEKPTLEQAERYCASDRMYWNSGMFCGSIKLFLQEFQQYAPKIYTAVKQFLATSNGYEQAPAISIDYAIMEKSTKIYGLPVEFFWSDVGNLDTFLSLALANDQTNALIQIDAQNNLVNAEGKLAVLIGVHDLCIVETDDALLVTNRKDAERVKQVLAELKARGLTAYL